MASLISGATIPAPCSPRPDALQSDGSTVAWWDLRGDASTDAEVRFELPERWKVVADNFQPG